jgi:predicted N-acetyltransferase YhbS
MVRDIARLTVRDLEPGEFERFGEIDRSERIEAQYVAEGGSLRLVAADIDVLGWFPSEVEGYIARLHAVHEAGGSVLGAFDGSALVAVASLDVSPVESIPPAMKLDLLHVSAPHRNRGIGKELTRILAGRAQRLGAEALYISATPTKNTVDAYRRIGAHVLESPDPELLALEPEDIHLLLPLGA